MKVLYPFLARPQGLLIAGLAVIPFLLPHAARANPQAPAFTVMVNNQAVEGIPVAPGMGATLAIQGEPAQPFALGIGPTLGYLSTPYGLFRVNVNDDDFFVLYNGFDANHPDFANSFIPAGGTLTRPVIPFPAGTPPGSTLCGQGIVASPSLPLLFGISNLCTVQAIQVPPAISSVDPNLGPPGMAVTIYGANFDAGNAAGSANAVTLNGVACPITAWSSTDLVVTVPAGARSGIFRVTTPGGTSQATPDLLQCWFAVTEDIANAPSLTYSVLQTNATLLGAIVFPGVPDIFNVECEVGEEIYVELYSYDPASNRITGPQNGSSYYFDPLLRITPPSTAQSPTVEDDDSGPTLNAGFGFAYGGTPAYAAGVAGTYTITATTYLGTGIGSYLLTIGVRPLDPMSPPGILAIEPNNTLIGQSVTIFGSGFQANAAANTVVFGGGVQASPFASLPGRLIVTVPAGARSGAINVVTPYGTTTSNPEFMTAYFVALLDMVTEPPGGPALVLSASATIFGAVTMQESHDEYYLEVVESQSVSVEVYAYDATTNRAVTSGFLYSTPLDPEARILPILSTSPIYALDGNGGPGYNAMIGYQSPTPAWNVPATGTYRLVVNPWFSFSRGPYILNVTIE